MKTLDEFAGLVGDDLRGYFETKNGERVRTPGLLESFSLSQEQADALILQARIAAGWIDAPDAEASAEEVSAADEPEALAGAPSVEEDKS